MTAHWKALGRTLEVVTIVVLVLAVGYLWFDSDSKDTERPHVPIQVPDVKTHPIEQKYRHPPTTSADTDTYQQAEESLPPIDVSPPIEQYQPQYQPWSASNSILATRSCSSIRTSSNPDFLAAHGGGTSLKIATVAPERSAWVQDIRRGAREIKERTDGRVNLKLYVGGIQGDPEQVLRAIRMKRLHGAALTPTDLQDRYPDINIYGLPFLFESADEVEYVRNQLDDRLLRGLEEAGFVSFGLANGGFAYLMSNVPVHGLKDLEGRRIWVPEGDRISHATFDALGLSPITLPITDVMTGLQTGLIDVVVFPPAGTMALQWHTKVKYFTEMPILFSIGLLVIDAKAFARLSAGDQQTVCVVMEDIYAEFNRREPEESQTAKQALLNAGVQNVIPTDREAESIREIAEITNRQLAELGYFSIDLYEELLLHLEEYRNTLETADGAP